MSNSPKEMVKGSCQCGSVTYSSTTLPSSMSNCHCSICRKISGAPFLPFVDFPASSITWTSGESSVKKTQCSKIAERAHCRNCGSPLYMQLAFEPDQISIAAGTIDEGSVQGELCKPNNHIFLEEKAGWYDLPEDRLPRYDKYPPELQKLVDAFKDTLSGPSSG